MAWNHAVDDMCQQLDPALCERHVSYWVIPVRNVLGVAIYGRKDWTVVDNCIVALAFPDTICQKDAIGDITSRLNISDEKHCTKLHDQQYCYR